MFLFSHERAEKRSNCLKDTVCFILCVLWFADLRQRNESKNFQICYFRVHFCVSGIVKFFSLMIKRCKSCSCIYYDIIYNCNSYSIVHTEHLYRRIIKTYIYSYTCVVLAVWSNSNIIIISFVIFSKLML